MIKHYSIRITGKVQSVYFRAGTKETAVPLGITGFVRNEPDGSVYIEAEGEEKQLAIMMAWCRQGPPRAIVEQIACQKEALRHYTDFEIR